MIKVIEDPKRINNLHKKFHSLINGNFNHKINGWVGFPGDSLKNDIRYSAEFDLWISVQELNNKFWNGFGVNKPDDTASNSLVGEINFPYSGINRRIGGAFAESLDGNIFILHRGNIRQSAKGIGKKFFLDNFSGDFITAIDGDRETEFCFIAELNSKYFFRQIADFIEEIYRVKNLESIDNFDYLNDFSYTDEHFGVSVTEKNDPVVIERTHGIVVNSLAKLLKSKGLKIGKDKKRDLFIHNKKKITTLFEIKTSSSTQSLYSAIGQLLLYSIPIRNDVKLVAVLPDKLNRRVEKRFKDLGIEIFYYKWKNGNPSFSNIISILN